MVVPGLIYVPGYVPADAEAALLASVDGEPWRGDLKRRV
jgi:hypothetical protein